MRGAVCGKLLGLDEVKGIDQRRVAPTLKPRDRRLVTKNWNSSQEPRNLTRTAHVGMFELIMRRPAPIEIPGGVRRKSGVDGGTKQVNQHGGKQGQGKSEQEERPTETSTSVALSTTGRWVHQPT